MTVEAVDVVLDEVGVPLTLGKIICTALQGSGTGRQYRPGDGVATQASPALVLGIVL